MLASPPDQSFQRLTLTQTERSTHGRGSSCLVQIDWDLGPLRHTRFRLARVPRIRDFWFVLNKRADHPYTPESRPLGPVLKFLKYNNDLDNVSED